MYDSNVLLSPVPLCMHHQGSHPDWKMGRHFPVREKSGNFEQTGKVRKNHTKYWKIQRISDIYMSHFSYACKTEGANGISHLISETA